MQFRFGENEVNVSTRTLVHAGRSQGLEPKVFDVLVMLLTHRERVVTKDELLDAVWGGRVVTDGVLTRTIMKARRLIGEQNLQQMFSKKSWVEFIKSNLKVLLLSALVTVLLRDALDPLVKVPPLGVAAVGMVFVEMLKKLVVYTFVAYGALAIADLVWQRAQHVKELMMSTDEIKQEHKQMEGDPEVKSHRKELAKEIAMGEAGHNTRKASVVVTNPTHLAIAIRYERDVTPLPIVVAKGAGEVALMMKRVAEEAGVPVMQDIPLARGLMRQARLHHYIPSEFVEPVAALLRELQRLAAERGEGLSA